MTTNESGYRVEFPDWYDERGEWEAEAKGWLQGVHVRFTNGADFPLFFYHPVRLAQDLEAESQIGRPCIAYHGLIIVPDVTRVGILTAIKHLVEANYFDSHGNSKQTFSANGAHTGSGAADQVLA